MVKHEVFAWDMIKIWYLMSLDKICLYINEFKVNYSINCLSIFDNIFYNSFFLIYPLIFSTNSIFAVLYEEFTRCLLKSHYVTTLYHQLSICRY